MANTSSAIKRIRSSERKRQRNILVRSAVRTALKKANGAVQAKETGAATSVKAAVSSLDRAASKKVFHRNTAARKKSRLMKKLNKASAPTQA